MTNAVQLRCDACGTALQPGLVAWHNVCSGCGLESSTLKPEIGDSEYASPIDESKRESALHPIRDVNFDTILRWIDGYPAKAGDRAERPKLLDVGCAHGWFAAKARKRFDVVGIEPDRPVAMQARKRCVDVRIGYFPDVLGEHELFDVIIFNDVLEHLPRVTEVLGLCRRHLAEGGVIVVNAPDHRGALYRLSKALALFGVTSPFERMWQVGMPSPHLYYFDSKSMIRAARSAGLEVRQERRLPAILLRGLYSRIRFDRRTSLFSAFVLYIGTLAVFPLLRVLPPDISVWFLGVRRE